MPSIEDSLIRRQIFNMRFSNGESVRAVDFLAEIYARINDRLMRVTGSLEEVHLSQLRHNIDIILAQGFDEFNDQFRQAVLDFAADENDFMFRALDLDLIGVPQAASISSIENSVLNFGMDTPLGPTTVTLNDAIAQFTVRRSADIRLLISDGFLEGRTNREIVKDIQNFAGGRSRAQIRTLVRTAINHAASMARRGVILENQALFSSEKWVAVLDNRTTLICGGRDGRLYPVGRGPYPPAHWNCRSLRVPIIKEAFAVDPIPDEDLTFDTWLRRQSAGFQNDYFSQFPDGLEKARLFRRGGLEIQFFRDETGRNFTLKELRAMEPLAFELANIPPTV